ncbi:MAG: hypothetical protein LBJ39_02400 [Tannerellaceae bacterium]|jgi:O-antigen/teichoic acid export membrane protein|nr:hypothetical protein [Tannerellaceae bacterium]
MDRKETSNDWLRPLFNRMPEETLPVAFREELMNRVLKEAARRRKRNERLELSAIILASLFMAGLSAGAFIYADIPAIKWEISELAGLSYYIRIGSLALVLLGVDYLFRRAYRKKHF